MATNVTERILLAELKPDYDRGVTHKEGRGAEGGGGTSI
jgi:hypothetical protein